MSCCYRMRQFIIECAISLSDAPVHFGGCASSLSNVPVHYTGVRFKVKFREFKIKTPEVNEARGGAPRLLLFILDLRNFKRYDCSFSKNSNMYIYISENQRKPMRHCAWLAYGLRAREVSAASVKEKAPTSALAMDSLTRLRCTGVWMVLFQQQSWLGL